MGVQPLEGIRVLDLSNHITGAYCTKQFADYGAEVTKVEKPSRGCLTRHLPPFAGDDPHPDKGLAFLYLNTNKKSITLNLKTLTGQKILMDLVRCTDILVESFVPGTMESWGLDYDTLEKVNPTLVMASISNFGQTGPYRDFRASDLVLYAMGGAMSSTGLPEKPPINKAKDACLYETGLQAWYAILGVYLGTLRDGIGDYIDISIMETELAGCERRTSHLLTYQYTGDISKRINPDTKIGIMPRMIACKDGMINMVIGPGKFSAALELIGRGDLKDDPNWNIFNFAIEDEVRRVLEEGFAKKGKQEWAEIFQDAGLICTPVNKPDDVCRDEHWKARGFFVEQDHSVAGHVTFPRGAVRTAEEWWLLKNPAPTLGQHNREVLGQLGYNDNDLTRLRAQGVI